MVMYVCVLTTTPYTSSSLSSGSIDTLPMLHVYQQSLQAVEVAECFCQALIIVSYMYSMVFIATYNYVPQTLLANSMEEGSIDYMT